MQILQSKTALVTGGSRGIGAAIAERLASEGANVAISYQSSPEKANELIQKLQSYGIQAKAYQSNAADFQQSELLVQNVIQELGVLDILVNNAWIPKDNLLLRMSE